MFLSCSYKLIKSLGVTNTSDSPPKRYNGISFGILFKSY